MNIDELKLIKTDNETCRRKIIETINKYDEKEVKSRVSMSTLNSILQQISNITISNRKLNGFYIFPDEIDPEELTKYLIKARSYKEPYEDIYNYICYALRRSINKFYRCIKEGNVIYNNGLLGNYKYMNTIKEGYKERYYSDKLKIIRRTSKR